LFIENWRFFESFENAQNQRFFAFAVFEVLRTDQSFDSDFFSKYLNWQFFEKAKKTTTQHWFQLSNFQLPLKTGAFRKNKVWHGYN
jgi:hypothetical protein